MVSPLDWHHVTGLQGEGGVRSEDVQDSGICDRNIRGWLGGLGCTKTTEFPQRSVANQLLGSIDWIAEEKFKSTALHVHLEVFRICLS